MPRETHKELLELSASELLRGSKQNSLGKLHFPSANLGWKQSCYPHISVWVSTQETSREAPNVDRLVFCWGVYLPSDQSSELWSTNKNTTAKGISECC